MCLNLSFKAGLLAFMLLSLSACNSGGSDEVVDLGLDSGRSEEGGIDWETIDTWKADVFYSSGYYSGYCSADNWGAFYEKMWLRAWSDETYLWYDEIHDENPKYYSLVDYFTHLKTDAVTATGNDKDQYHFSMDSYEYFILSNYGEDVGYGLNVLIQNESSTTDRATTVSYVEPNSPASLLGIQRGASIVTIDGVSMQYASTTAELEALRNGMFPSTSGKSTEFEILDQGSSQTRTVTLTSQYVEINPVLNTKVVDNGGTKVGYLQFNSHMASAESLLIDSIEELKAQQVTELVLNVRYNGGGLLSIASQLSYMLAGKKTVGKVFEQLTFNDKYPTINPITGDALEPISFINTAEGVQLPTLNLDRVYVLTTQDTCSASESIINGLRGIDVEVIQIGAATCGKPYGFYPTNNCDITYFTVQFKGANHKGFGDYADGFSPSQTPTLDSDVLGCPVMDDLTKMLGNTSESMFATALHHQKYGACPVTINAFGQSSNSVSIKRNEGYGSNFNDLRPAALVRGNKIINP